MAKKETREEHPEKSAEHRAQESIAQLQIIEQNLQSLLMQKQAFQFEANETSSALDELKKAKPNTEVFKIVGSLMFRSDKNDLEKDLQRKMDIINLRLKTIEKQEEELKNNLLSHRDEILKTLKK